jgi:hypothetical protein
MWYVIRIMYYIHYILDSLYILKAIKIVRKNLKTIKLKIIKNEHNRKKKTII